MKNVTLKFPRTEQMLEYIRVAHLCNFEFSAKTRMLTSDLSEKELDLAATYDAVVDDGSTEENKPGSKNPSSLNDNQ